MRKIWIILSLAIIVRVILSLISFHPDIQAFAMGDWVLSQGNIGNFYDFLKTLHIASNLQQYPADFFIYPPAIYFYHYLFYFLYSPFLSQNIQSDFLFQVTSGFGNTGFNLELLFLKIPYMVFDIPAAFLFAKLFEDKKQTLAFTLWLFNPVSLYGSYLMGQFDIIPASFVVFALFVLYKQKKILNISPEGMAAILLGLGAAFKIYPLFLLVALISIKSDWQSRIKLLFYGCLAYGATILPFLFSHGFRSSALVAGLTSTSLYANLPVSGGESILYFEALVLFCYIVFLSRKGTVRTLWQRFFIVLLLFFTFTHYHPQWFVWLSPFLIMELLENNFRNILAVILSIASFTGLLFFFDPSLTLGFFVPVDPSLHTVSSLWQILHIKLDYNFSRSVLQTLFVGASIYYLYYYFPRRAED